MGVLTVRNNSFKEGHAPCPVKDISANELDNSQATTKTVDIEEEIIAMAHPPIIISEEDAHHNQEHVKETRFHTSLIKDSIQVQKCHKVNDDEIHEENPHLEDYMIPHHSVHVERPEEADKAAGEKSCTQEATDKVVSTKMECCTHVTLHTEATSSSTAVEDEPQETPKRKVHFGTVLVREYDMILGDHPCCGYGPPVTLDWDYLEYEPLDVNDYEFHRPPRRGLRGLLLNYYMRMKLLSDAGYTKVDFRASKKQMSRAKMNRSMTKKVAYNYPLMKVEDAVESACRKFKRLIKQDHWKADKLCLAA